MSQTNEVVVMQNAATVNNDATHIAPVIDASGYTGCVQVEIAETNGGTATVTLQGSFDGTNWYAIGYQLVDATATPARAASGVSVLANSRHVYQVLDPYPLIRAQISSVATSPVLTVKAYLVQQ